MVAALPNPSKANPSLTTDFTEAEATQINWQDVASCCSCPQLAPCRCSACSFACSGLGPYRLMPSDNIRFSSRAETGMCRASLGVVNRYVGNMQPMPGVFPDYPTKTAGLASLRPHFWSG
jgi:hypothetical protein